MDNHLPIPGNYQGNTSPSRSRLQVTHATTHIYMYRQPCRHPYIMHGPSCLTGPLLLSPRCVRPSTVWTLGPAACPPCHPSPGGTTPAPLLFQEEGSTPRDAGASSSTPPCSWWTQPPAPPSRCGATAPPACPREPGPAGTPASPGPTPA